MKTRIVIANELRRQDDVIVWVTLGATPGCLQDVSKIPFITHKLNNLVGYFVLAGRHSTLPYAPDEGFNANISFNTQPLNCPTLAFPNGVNLFEFIINNAFQGKDAQETADISCVAGANAEIIVDFGGPAWNAGPTQLDIKHIVNGAIGMNTGAVGVYPVGCDKCTKIVNPPKCPNPLKHSKPQAEAICNVQRPADYSGGIVTVRYGGPLS